MPSLSSEKNLKVLSFGCGPCTDLFAIDYLRVSGKLCYQILDYRGVDYSRDVWNFIVQFIQIALHGSVGYAGQLHRIGKDFIARLFPVKPPCVMLSCAF